jgi:gamma-glutamyl-gamma-aminobutyrate hydrolase PuuD
MNFLIPIGSWPLKTEPYKKWFKGLGINIVHQGEYDGLILPGGADIGVRDNRDDVEYRLITENLGKKPIIGICRGLQIYLDYLGYPIIGHIPDFSKKIFHTTIDGGYLSNSSWHTTVKYKLWVNSRHHQGFSILDVKNYEEIDCTNDTIIEYYRDKDFFGVQWHPELIDPSEESDKWIKIKIKKYINGFTKI